VHERQLSKAASERPWEWRIRRNLRDAKSLLVAEIEWGFGKNFGEFGKDRMDIS